MTDQLQQARRGLNEAQKAEIRRQAETWRLHEAVHAVEGLLAVHDSLIALLEQAQQTRERFEDWLIEQGYSPLDAKQILDALSQSPAQEICERCEGKELIETAASTAEYPSYATCPDCGGSGLAQLPPAQEEQER